LTFNHAGRSLLNGGISLIGPRYHYFDESVEISVSGGTAPFIRGFGTFANLRSTGDLGDVFIEVSTAPTGTMGIKVKLGAAATYDGTEIIVTPGEWFTLLDENDVSIGDEDLPVEGYWPDLSGINIADEWSFDRERAVWSPSLPATSSLNEIAATVLLDGAKFRAREISITSVLPAEPDEAIGGRFLEDDQISEFGDRTVAGQLNRRAIDSEIEDRLDRGEPFSIRLDAKGPLIGATGVRRQFSLIMMQCKASGRTPSIGGKAAFDEPFNWTAHPSADVTYPDPLTIEIVNSQASLA
jgi:hypothetical protein